MDGILFFYLRLANIENMDKLMGNKVLFHN